MVRYVFLFCNVLFGILPLKKTEKQTPYCDERKKMCGRFVERLDPLFGALGANTVGCPIRKMTVFYSFV